MPLVLGIITTIAVFGLWQQLLVREQFHIQQLVQQEATALESELNRELSTRIPSLERMASRWQVSGGTPKALWEVDAANYINHSYGYQAIEWVDSSFHVRWIVPLQGNEAAQNLDMSQESRRRITLNIARDLHQTILTRTVSLAQGGEGFLAVVPLYVNDNSSRPDAERFDGFIIGVFRFQALFDSILEMIPEYQVQIADDNGLIYSQGTPLSTVQPETRVVQAYGAGWQVQVFPTPALLNKERSPLPNLILGSGLLSSWSLALVVYLGQRAERSTRQARKINQQLQAEIAERQRIETELREMAEVMEYAISGISRLNSQGHYLYVNKAYADITGYLPDEMVGMDWQRTVHPDDLEQVSNAYQQMMQNGKVEVEARGIRKDGSSFYKQLVMVSTYDKHQQFVGHYCFLKNISDRKRAEEALRQSESTLRSFFNSEAMLMGIVELHEHDILHLSDNQTAANFFGTTPEAMRNRFASEMGAPQNHVQQWIRAYQEAERTQSPVHFEYLHEAPSGQHWLAAHVCPIGNHSSYHPRFSYIVEDITERKHTELALENELMRSQMLFNTSIDGIVILNHQGNVVQASSSFAQMLGYTIEETFQLNITDWDAQWTPQELQQVMSGTLPVPPVFETIHRRRDGSRYAVEISYNRVKLNGEVMHFCICRDISDRKRMEAERQRAEDLLKLSQAQFKALVNNMPGMVYRYYPQQDGQPHSFTYISSQCRRLLELEPEEIVQDADTFVNLIHPDDLSSFVLSVNYAVEGFLPWHWQGRITTPSGQLKWIEGNSQAQATPEGDAWDGLLLDISDRKQAEIALQNSQARFAGILEIASDAIITVNSNQEITLFNKGAERIFGYQAEEMLGQPLSILMPDRFAQLHHHHVNQYAKSDSKARAMAQRGTIFGRRKDGTEFPAEASISKLTLNGEITFTTFLRDITERQKAEAAIAHLAAIIESSEDAIISKSLDGIITSWNAAAEKLFGYTAAEIIGQSITVLIPDNFLDEEAAILKRIRSGQTIRSYDTRRRRKDGSLVDISISISPIKDAEGTIIGASKIARDIRERIQLEKQRLQAEQALRESEERFQAFMRHNPAIAWITDANGVVLYLNQTYLRTFRVPKDFIGKSIFDLFPSNIAQSLLDNIQTVAHTQQALEAIEIAPRQDGSMGNFLVYKFPIPDISGQILVGGMAIDRTQQYQAEAALQESEERLQLALEASGDGLWDWNVVTGDVYYSPQYMTMLGYEADELPHNFETWEYLTHPDDQAWVLDTLNAHMRDSSKQYAFDYRVRTKSGDWKWIANYGKVVAYDSQGHPLRMIGTHQDISDRKQAETELKHQKDMLQVIVNHIPVMIALFNPEGRVEFVNPEFERVLGWSLADWQQEDVLLKCNPDPAYCRTVIEHMVAVNGSWKDFTTLTKTGQAIETSWINVQLSNGSNLGIGQDISDRKRKEIVLKQAMEAAEAANLAKSMFLANMSHELRTPLNVILGFAQVMAHDSFLTPSQREDLQTIQRSGDHLLSLINDVLDLSKIEAGHCLLEETGFDLISLLHSLRTMMTERAKGKRLQLTFDIAPDVPQFVVADEQKLRQILLNLLSNAIKFTDQGGVALRVTSQESPDQLCPAPGLVLDQSKQTPSVFSSACQLQFEVSDTGVGIAPSDLTTIFDAFVQAEAGRKSVSGTGLGLTISRRLLELMHGTIAVQSEPDVGSRFTVTIPVCPTVGADMQPEQCDRTVIGLAPGQPHRRILVVDDQRENRLVIVRLLTQLGLEVREAVNGQEAIQIWQEWQPDLTWMDIRMPGVDGYETTRQIRAMEQDQASIIIALTAQASHSDRTLAMAAGCNDYISKPFREKTIFLKLAEYLGLEYVYADSSLLTGTPTVPPDRSPHPLLDSTAPPPPSLADLSTLPPAWLSELEEAAACGNDRGILTLVTQLPPDLTDLADYLTHLANQCQFEQILHVLPHVKSG